MKRCTRPLVYMLISVAFLFLYVPVVFADLVGAWSARYQGSKGVPTELAVDDAGNVYVAGTETFLGTSHNDYVVVKFDVTGNKRWVVHYNGPLSKDDCLSAMVVDGGGNVYVTGESEVGDNYYERDIGTIKYDANGNELWVARYNGVADNEDIGRGVAVDSTGNVYVTGYSRQGNGKTDIVTIKYDSNGNEVWVAQYDGSAKDDDAAAHITVDGNNNVYVTGYTTTENSPDVFKMDFATIKYDTDGNQIWVATYEGPWGGDDAAGSLVVDASGHVYVAGRSEGEMGRDLITIKYDNNGNALWVARYINPGYTSLFRVGLSLDGQGYAYMFGSGRGPAETIVLKYDNDGNEVWLSNSGPESLDDAIVDDAGNVYLAGSDDSADTVFVTQLNDSGNEVWNDNFDGGFTTTSTQLVAADTYGNVYVTAGVDNDFFTVKYSPDTGGPVVDFSASPVAGEAPLAVTFSDLTVGTVDSWQWDFDDNGIVDSTDQNPTYTYNTPGAYSVLLLVSGPEGQRFLRKDGYITVDGLLITKILHKRCANGDRIKLIGTGFGDIQGDSVLHIGDKVFDSTSRKIKLWSDTKISFRVKFPVRWFERKAGKKVKVWVTVNGVASNLKPIIPLY